MADEAANPAATATGTEPRAAPADEQPGTALGRQTPRRPPSPSRSFRCCRARSGRIRRRSGT